MIYLDIFIESIQQGSRIRLKPLPGQQVPEDYFISCARSTRSHYRIGTIYKADVKLIQRQKGKSYLMTRFKNKPLQPALEFYNHNISLL